MSTKIERALLVGDNPFHNISHISQERARARDGSLANAEYAAELIRASLENGANGFMFSISEVTLSILREMQEVGGIDSLDLYAIAPYAYEYVQLATQMGGIPGLAKKTTRQIVGSRNMSALIMGLKGIIRADPVSLMKAYLAYEISRVKSSAGKHVRLTSVLLHEVITDMALALNLDTVFKSYVDFLVGRGMRPGFNTCNFPHLINKLREWNIDLKKVIIAAPFNEIGFQMNPSKGDCERALKIAREPILIAISIFAAGYLKPEEAIEYIATLPNVKGVAVGVSKEKHARETFRLLNERLSMRSRF